MKKVRLMLATITILGAVGGALALRAKLPSPQVCIGPLTTIVCTIRLTAGFAIAPGSGVNYFTTNNPAGCPGFTRCTIHGLPVEE